MFCTGCGTANPDTATFCNNCGKALAATPAAAPPAAPSPAPARPAYTGPPESSGKATGSLILGILGMLLSWVLIGIPMAIAAIILGHMSYSQIKHSAGRLTGEGKALTGLILGYLSVVSIPFVLIVAAIAIPNLLRARIAANEASAVGSIRSISVAEISYQAAYNQGFTCDLAALDGAGQGQPDAAHAQLIDSTLGAGTKTGYRFALSGCEGSPAEHYKLVAEPVSQGQTGTRTFCSDESGVIRYVKDGSGEECLASGQPLE